MTTDTNNSKQNDDPEVDKVLYAASLLDSLAGHFALEDWNYTRNHDIERITYRKNSSSWEAWDSLPHRVKDTYKALYDRLIAVKLRARRGQLHSFDKLLNLSNDEKVEARIYSSNPLVNKAFSKAAKLGREIRHEYYGVQAVIKVNLRKDKRLPDGVLDNGSIITYWEETGEYLNIVQPSVGLLFARTMFFNPSNAHCLKVADEIARIANTDCSKFSLEYDPELIEARKCSPIVSFVNADDKIVYAEVYVGIFDNYKKEPYLKIEVLNDENMSDIEYRRDYLFLSGENFDGDLSVERIIREAKKMLEKK